MEGTVREPQGTNNKLKTYYNACVCQLHMRGEEDHLYYHTDMTQGEKAVATYIIQDHTWLLEDGMEPSNACSTG
jgi:hypothetical protein